MSVDSPSHVGEILGAGIPNYLWKPYAVCVATIGGTEYAFVAGHDDDALTIFDISVPASPSHVGEILGAGSPNYLDKPYAVCVATIGGTEYALVASESDDSLSIFDVSTPSSPSLAGVIYGGGSPNYLNKPRSVFVASISGTEYAFVASFNDNALTIIDVSTPASPSHVGEITGAGIPNYLGGASCVHVATISGTEYAFVVSETDNALTVIDVSTPSSPSQVGEIYGAGSPNYLEGAVFVYVVTISGTEYAVVASGIGDALTIIDVSTPASPSHVATAMGNGAPNYLNKPTSIFVATIGTIEYALIASQTDDALTIFDISIPSSPIHAGAINGAGSPNYLNAARSVYVVTIGGVEYAVIVSDNDNALTIFNVSAPAASLGDMFAIGTGGWWGTVQYRIASISTGGWWTYIGIPVDPPVAAFYGTPLSGYQPLIVNFYDQSTNDPDTWAWDIDNNGVIDYTTQNCQHTYTNAGQFSVKLTVENIAGSDFELKTNYITVTSAAGLIVFRWDTPDDSELYVELYAAVHLMGDSDSKDSYQRVATVRSDLSEYGYAHDYPSGIVLVTKARVIDKSGRVSPFSVVTEVTV